MQQEIIQKKKIPAIVQIIARLAPDGFFEVIVDVTGGFAFKEKLKVAAFTFVRDRSVGLGADAPLTKDGQRATSAAWRRIIAAVPPTVPPEKVADGLDIALADLDALLSEELEGSRIKGARASARKIFEQWPEAEGIKALTDKLIALDTPWQETDVISVPRPKFAA